MKTAEELEQERLDLEAEDRGDEVDPDLKGDDDDEFDGDEHKNELDEEGEPAAKPEKKSGMVPHARFNEVNEEAKSSRQRVQELEEELARAKGEKPAPEKEPEKPAPAAYDYDAAEDRYAEALLEGDTTAAKVIRREIRAQETADSEQRGRDAFEQSKQQDEQARATQSLQAVAKDAYARFPFLNSEGTEPDADAIEMVLALRNKHIRDGVSAGEALLKAVDKIGPMFGDEKPVKSPVRESVIERNLERDKKIPPREQGLGDRGRNTDVSSMTDEEFDKLTEKELREMRGDFLG
ncbi:MAG: hypothetical protein K2Y25_09295 [Pseudomonadaceae bacterium]|nr:hypothetical protein [Pseudomonadaceae bacterium]